MTLRVGIVDYLNSWPLAWGFLTGRVDPDRLLPEYLPPAEVAEGLERGTLDIGLVPSIEVPRLGDLRVLPGLCVAATHEVRSVLLISSLPVDRWRRVALDANSRTSAALVRILLEERYGVSPELVKADPVLEDMLSAADAALVIGDPALAIDREGYRVMDLAAEWRDLTGSPFVFAVWAVRHEVAIGEEIVAHFHRSLELGEHELQAVVRRAVETLGIDEPTAWSYLTENLRFHLGSDELTGLEEFYRRAHLGGLLARAATVTLL